MTDGRIQQFYEAVNSGLEDVIRQMLDADPSLVTVETEQRGGTPLHWVSLTGEVGIVELLIAKSADANAEDSDGLTPLQLAASVGNAEVIRTLLRNGAGVLAGRDHGLARLPVVETEGNSAVRVLAATMMKHRDMLKRLVRTTEPDTSERNLILETIQPTYSDPERSAFALALAETGRAGVLDTLSPLIQSVKQCREKLIELSIGWKRSNPPFGEWNDAFLKLNDGINALCDYVGVVEASLGELPAKAEMRARRPSESENVFRCDGDWWTVTFAGKMVRLTRSHGLAYIHHLLSRPGLKCHVSVLIRLTGEAAADSRWSGGAEAFQQGAVEGVFFESSGLDGIPMLEPDERKRLERQRTEFRRQIDVAEKHGDMRRADELRADLEAITKKLAAARTLGGGIRKVLDRVEKDRKAVTNRIRATLQKIKEHSPALWQHLFNAIETGSHCSYTPEEPITWVL